ncbi:MAG: VWA domain-containing protein [Flavobacteriaceae bacterium]|nr:VWA domain-containing protein [Flavobacteriaceae bacterium]
MFEPDEYIFKKLAYFFKRKSKQNNAAIEGKVSLDSIKSRLSLLAKAITGDDIQLFSAEREGGYKNNNFFLPDEFYDLGNEQYNINFYLFRTVYLCFQKKMNINFRSKEEVDIVIARQLSEDVSAEVLKEMMKEFPFVEETYKELKNHYHQLNPEKPDYTYIYGKFMYSPAESDIDKLKNISDVVKTAVAKDVSTIIKAKAVEEVEIVTLDKKAQEDFTLSHNFEKAEAAEEYDGGFRDFDGDDDLEDHENALEDLNMKHAIRVDDTAHSVYQSDFVENTSVAESTETTSEEHSISYDEWDYKKMSYLKDHCKVYPRKITTSNINYYSRTMADNKTILLELRKTLTSANNKYKLQYKQSQGEQYDLDALIDYCVDLHAKRTPSENIYLSKRKREKDLSILILLDLSLSSDGYSGGNRVIDVEKQVSIIFGEILNEFGVEFAINGFYSKTRSRTSYVELKGFDDSWDKAKHRIGEAEPSGYTRIGPALRHSASIMEKRDSKNKWLLLLSDGKPNDYDKYEGKHGLNDVKQALRELEQKNINSFALAIESQAKYYLPQMFGVNNYEILSQPVEMLEALAKLFEKIRYMG